MAITAVVALFDVLDETGVGGLPAQEFLGDTTPRRSPSVWIPPTAIVIDEVDLRNAPFTDGARSALRGPPSRIGGNTGDSNVA